MKRQRQADATIAALEDAFAPGRFIANRACFDFIHELERDHPTDQTPYQNRIEL